MTFIVKNWNEFQHYKDRSPSWIKLHKGLLDDFEYQCLPIASKALAPMIWLLASEQTDGVIPSDIQKIAFRLRMRIEDVQIALEPLIHAGFIISDSNTLADCYQSACLEKRREEIEIEREVVAPKRRNSVVKEIIQRPDEVDEELWYSFLEHKKRKKSPLSKIAWDGIVREASKANWSISDAIREIIERDWKGFKAGWVSDARSVHLSSTEYDPTAGAK